MLRSVIRHHINRHSKYGNTRNILCRCFISH